MAWDGIVWTGIVTPELERQYLVAKAMVDEMIARKQTKGPGWNFWRYVQLSGSQELVRRGLGTSDLGQGVSAGDEQALMEQPHVDYRIGEHVYVLHPPTQAFPHLYEPVTMGMIEDTRRDGGVDQVLIRFSRDTVFWLDAIQISREDLHHHYDGLWADLPKD